MCDKMAICAYILKIVEKNPFLSLQMRAIRKCLIVTNFNFNRHFKISFPRENEAIKYDLVEFKVQCLKVFCYHGNTSTVLLFYSIFRTTPEVSSKLYFVEVCQVSEKLWLLIIKELICGFQILDLKDYFSASLKNANF